MDKLRTDFKDEIAKPEYQMIDSQTNAVIHNRVKLKRVDIPEQVGDQFSAGILNKTHEAINELQNIANPNILINGDSQVWQRGEEFVKKSGYTADRCRS